LRYPQAKDDGDENGDIFERADHGPANNDLNGI
jgi:hypothetical protein